MRRGKSASILRIPKRRLDKLLLLLVRESFRFLSVFPHFLSARWAELLFLTPPRQARTRQEREVLSRGRFRNIPFRNCRLATWSWGDGPRSSWSMDGEDMPVG